MKLTKPQQQKLLHLWQRENQNKSYLQFRRTVSPELGYPDVAMVWWSGMWLGIETDGRSNS